MKPLCLAGLASLAAMGAQAQVPASPFRLGPFEPLAVTATRELQPAASLRDTTVITREELDSAGALSLGELLERRAGIQLKGTGGAGQPQGLFIRGAGSAQTLVLVDGLRVSSASVGTTSIENVPLESIERIEVVKGPLSSLYGSNAIGGVVQIFTRGKSTPHLFGTMAYGTENDRRVSAGLATADERTTLSFSGGARKVDAASATNPRSGTCHDADRDPHENYFANVHGSHRMWQDEVVSIDLFGIHGKTAFDCGAANRNDQMIAGVRLSSSNNFTPWWASRLSLGHGRDKISTPGTLATRFETLQDQATWINQLKTPAGSLLVGLEFLREHVRTDQANVFVQASRDTKSGFLGLNEAWGTQRLEASVRRDDGDDFGKRTTGSASYGTEWGTWGRVSATVARGFRSPTFFDTYGPTSSFYHPNPALRPETSASREISLRAPVISPWQWRVTAFDNRIEDLIVFVPSQSTVQNVNRARIRGAEASVDGAWRGTRLRVSITAQRPRDEETGQRLPLRAEHLGSVDLSRSFGPWTVGMGGMAVGQREEPLANGNRATHSSYVLVDARVRYRFEKFWSVELAGTNLANKRYESATGYDAPARALMLSVRFDAT